MSYLRRCGSGGGVRCWFGTILLRSRLQRAARGGGGGPAGSLLWVWPVTTLFVAVVYGGWACRAAASAGGSSGVSSSAGETWCGPARGLMTTHGGPTGGSGGGWCGVVLVGGQRHGGGPHATAWRRGLYGPDLGPVRPEWAWCAPAAASGQQPLVTVGDGLPLGLRCRWRPEPDLSGLDLGAGASAALLLPGPER